MKNGSWFYELLKFSQNVEYFRFFRIHTPPVPEGSDLPYLKQLKTLKLFGCDDDIIKYFRTSSLTSLLISGGRGTSTASLSYVVDVIRRQENLTKLQLDEYKDMLFQKLCEKKPNGFTKLTKLVLHNYFAKVSISLTTFIKMHSKTLKTLSLVGRYPKTIYEIIFADLTSLKNLSLGMPDNIDFDDALKKNLSIENLSFRWNMLSPLNLSRLCNSMPNIKALTLWDEPNTKKLQVLTTMLCKVTKLSVYKFDSLCSKLKFKNLTSLHTGDLLAADWDAFTIANPKITEIVIHKALERNFNLKQIDIISHNLKLQTFQISSSISTNEHFLSTIRNNFPNLKVLDLDEFRDTLAFI